MDINTEEKRRIQPLTVAKVAFLVYHILVIIGMSLAIALLLIPNAKSMLLGTPFGKFLTKTTISEEKFQNVYDDGFKREEIVKNDELDTSILDKYLNIALFGLDSRDQSLDQTNSDTIMIVSIDRDSKEVKLVSVYRDSYQKIYGKNGSRYNKINSAYASGGAETAINTLNQNFDLDIQDYVAVNFNGIATIIDLLGGIDVNITEEERFYINGYLTETRKITGLDASDVYESGYVHLNGLQATAYCRIRYTAVYMEDGTVYNNDFGRTARQRIVLTQLIQKAKNAGLSQVMKLCDEVFKEENEIFKTSLSYDEVIDLIPIVLDFSLNSTTGYPFTYEGDAHINGASCVVVAGHAYNVAKLHEYLFNEKNYIPSSMVFEIDERIRRLTGIGTWLTEEDEVAGYDVEERIYKYDIYERTDQYDDYDYDYDYDDSDDSDEWETEPETIDEWETTKHWSSEETTVPEETESSSDSFDQESTTLEQESTTEISSEEKTTSEAESTTSEISTTEKNTEDNNNNIGENGNE